MIVLVNGKSSALPVYWRAALGSIDEVLVLEVNHFESVEEKGPGLHIMLGFFVIATGLTGPHPESADRDKDSSLLVEFILQSLALNLEAFDLLTRVINADGDFPCRILCLGDLFIELLLAVRVLAGCRHYPHQLFAVIGENRHLYYRA